jgi:glycosyltransferase involved in cell wall biosynthesis
MDVGRTAPGIVFERLIYGLSSLHQVDVLAADFNPSIDLSNVGKITILKKSYIHPRIHQFLISLFGIDPYDSFWAWRSMMQLKFKKLNQYEVVLSFLSHNNYASLIAGERVAKRIKCKYAVHSLDAIPAPPGWPINIGYFKGLQRLMSKYLSKANAFFSTNKQMLAYQLSTFVPSKSLITDVIYNPSIYRFKEFPDSKDKTNYFVYTGGIYGARNVKYLLEGFERLLEIYPDSYLFFVGSYLAAYSLQKLKQRTQDRIKVLPFTKELDTYYSISTALIDLDADIENDVFLSSKIINYIMINRIIISETGVNSPSRNLFKDIDSIIQCDHDSNQMYEAMKKSIIVKGKITFEDRKSISNLFSLENVVKRLDISLTRLFLI